MIRALIVPAVISLMGRWNWWLPSWPARLLRVEPSLPPRVATGRGGRMTIGLDSPASRISVADLRADLNGRVIAPDDEGYDQARTVFTAGSTAGRRSSSGSPTRPTSRGHRAGARERAGAGRPQRRPQRRRAQRHRGRASCSTSRT